MIESSESIDQAIQNVERLFSSITGERPRPLTGVPYAPIPPEKENDAPRFLEEQMDRLLSTLSSTSMRPESSWAPPMASWRKDDEVVIAIDVPGVPRESIELSMKGGLLELSALRAAPFGSNGKSGTEARSECSYGRMRRTILLPLDATAEVSSARLENGVLEVRIPCVKPRKGETKQISVH